MSKGAELLHVLWGMWVDIVLGSGARNEDGSVTIPAEKVKFWKDIILKPYDELSEEEKRVFEDYALEMTQKILLEVRIWTYLKGFWPVFRNWLLTFRRT